eukprot:3036969-Prymnesium_polylepis.1
MVVLTLPAPSLVRLTAERAPRGENLSSRAEPQLAHALADAPLKCPQLGQLKEPRRSGSPDDSALSISSR